MSVKKLRPHQILGLGNDFGRPYKSFIPPAYSGGLMALENVILIKFLNIINPSRIFEFGTYRGETARLIIENLDFQSNNDRKLYTLDLADLTNITFDSNDKDLAIHSINSDKVYLSSEKNNSVIQIYCDSLEFNPDSIDHKFELILVDANHSYKYVKNDTEKALKMIKKEKSVILWHDYNNPEFPDLSNYLDKLAANGLDLYHIEETMLCVLMSNDIKPANKIQSKHDIFFK